jgi:hypothetical protein
MRNKKAFVQYFFTTILVFVGVLANAQSTKISIKDNWDSADMNCLNCVFDAENATYSAAAAKSLPFRGSQNIEGRVTTVEYENLTLPSSFDKSSLPNEFQAELSFKSARSENILVAEYTPLIFVSGQVKFVKSFEIELSASPIPNYGNRDAIFASNSVLATGDWYKIGVAADGIQRINYEFLRELGIAVESLNPNHINIYGNHTPKLPDLNSDYHPDDLLKNAIQVVGDGDGVFNTNDYILFYGKGPDVVNFSSNKITARTNLIDSLNYYFIHISATDTPKRISSAAESPNPVTHNLTTYDDYAFYENDLENILGSGDIWFGEKFDAKLSYDISIPAENRVVSDPIGYKLMYGSDKKSGSASMKVSLNGTLVDDIPAQPLVEDTLLPI